jgi:hypothetical protein
MTLRQRQSVFARKVADLIIHAEALGYEVTLGDAYHDPQNHKDAPNAANSFHKSRLAIDINLYRNGQCLHSVEAHRPLAKWWKAQGGTWGGDFTVPESNHYSWGEGR